MPDDEKQDLFVRLAVLSEKLDALREDIREFKSSLGEKADSKVVEALCDKLGSLEAVISTHSLQIANAHSRLDGANSVFRAVGTMVGYLSGAIALIYHLRNLFH